MATLEIRKIEENLFKHIPSDNLNWFVSAFYCKTDGDNFQVVENSGSKRGEFHYSDVTVYDIGGGAENFASSQSLMQRLKELGYTGFFREGEVSPSLLSGFVKKDYSQIEVDSTSTGTNAMLPIPSDGRSTVVITNTSLSGINGFFVDTSEDVYDGKEYDIHNLTGNSVTIKHNNTATFFLSKNGNDVIIPNNEILKIKYSVSESGLKEWMRSWSDEGEFLTFTLSRNWAMPTLDRVYYINFTGAIEFRPVGANNTIIDSLTNRNMGMFITPYNCVITKVQIVTRNSGAFTGVFGLASGEIVPNSNINVQMINRIVHVSEIITCAGFFVTEFEFSASPDVISKGNVVSPCFIFSNKPQATINGVTIQIQIKKV